jgi:hypothetical protein
VPQHWDESGYALGSWVRNQRAGRRGYYKANMSVERLARLKALPGWTWASPRDAYGSRQRGGLAGSGRSHEAAWEDGYSHLERFVAREGHARVPSIRVEEDGYKLGLWVFNQRRFRRREKLSAERTARLEALPGWTWDARKKADS